jgi:hypothetical protein
MLKNIYSPGTPASSTIKTGGHDIAEILLKVAMNTIIHSFNQKKNECIITDFHISQQWLREEYIVSKMKLNYEFRKKIQAVLLLVNTVLLLLL